jgi:hypothetical protein
MRNECPVIAIAWGMTLKGLSPLSMFLVVPGSNLGRDTDPPQGAFLVVYLSTHRHIPERLSPHKLGSIVPNGCFI